MFLSLPIDGVPPGVFYSFFVCLWRNCNFTFPRLFYLYLCAGFSVLLRAGRVTGLHFCRSGGGLPALPFFFRLSAQSENGVLFYDAEVDLLSQIPRRRRCRCRPSRSIGRREVEAEDAHQGLGVDDVAAGDPGRHHRGTAGRVLTNSLTSLMVFSLIWQTFFIVNLSFARFGVAGTAIPCRPSVALPGFLKSRSPFRLLRCALLPLNAALNFFNSANSPSASSRVGTERDRFDRSETEYTMMDLAFTKYRPFARPDLMGHTPLTQPDKTP